MQNRKTDLFLALMAHVSNPDGLTDYELAEICKRQLNSINRRRSELRDLGFVQETNRKGTSPNGSPLTIWKVTKRGVKEFLKLDTPNGVTRRR
jgi:hypothetical protein